MWGQHAAVTAYGVYWHWLRFGPGYAMHEQGYRERDHWGAGDWENWQRQRLIELLSAAARHVPYYREVWSADEKRAAAAGQLDRLPLLEKQPIRANPRAFLREDLRPNRELVFHTSGSTGTPIASIWTIQEYRNALALREVRSVNWAGVSFRRPRATFSGRMVEPDAQSRGPFYRFNLVERQAYLSPFHLRPDTARQYVAALNKHRIEWITGYAVSAYLLAKFMVAEGLRTPTMRAVVTTSEKLTDEMRGVMEAAYGCRIFEEYSTVENALFASECERGRLHVSPDVAAVEILRPDGSGCEPGEVGEIVATCLMRDYQPFVRYRLGDLGRWDSEPCPCGRAMPVLKEVVGRLEDVVVGPDGRQMVRFHGIFVNQPHVQEGQIIQETRNRIRTKIVPCDGFSEADVRDIIDRVQQRLGDVEVVVETVDQIPRTQSGKFKAVISMLKPEEAERATA